MPPSAGRELRAGSLAHPGASRRAASADVTDAREHDAFGGFGRGGRRRLAASVCYPTNGGFVVKTFWNRLLWRKELRYLLAHLG
jgi:hypothetical protein